MLYTPKYRGNGNAREYCGPTAMAAVTGAPMDDIRDAIRQARGPEARRSDGGHMPIIGVSNKELLEAMELLGWGVVETMLSTDYEGPTPHTKLRLRDFLDMVQMREGSYIVNVTGHYIAASEGEVCDTYTKLPIAIPRWKRGMGRWVQNWW